MNKKKMYSFRISEKSLGQLEYVAHTAGLQKTTIIELGIAEIYKMTKKKYEKE